MPERTEKLDANKEVSTGSPVVSWDPPSSVDNEKRRRFAKIALGAPVLMTLASRSVLAATVQCHSSMMSGNTSPGHVSGQCSYGTSPGGWGEPGGTINGVSDSAAWSAINLVYGTYTPNCTAGNGTGPGNGNGNGNGNANGQTPGTGFGINQSACYTGGATLANVPAILNQNSLATTMTLRDVFMTNPDNHQLTRHLVCAYLNALHSAASSSFNYVLTTAQVLALAGGAPYPNANNQSLKDYLGSTWV